MKESTELRFRHSDGYGNEREDYVKINGGDGIPSDLAEVVSDIAVRVCHHKEWLKNFMEELRQHIDDYLESEQP